MMESGSPQGGAPPRFTNAGSEPAWAPLLSSPAPRRPQVQEQGGKTTRFVSAAQTHECEQEEISRSRATWFQKWEEEQVLHLSFPDESRKSLWLRSGRRLRSVMWSPTLGTDSTRTSLSASRRRAYISLSSRAAAAGPGIYTHQDAAQTCGFS